nr:hypothetical protein [uncultured Flavobacterium sp.]
MKKFLFLFLLVTTISYSQTKKETLVGSWKATDSNGVENKMVFSSDNYVSMTINGEFIDGKNYVIKTGKNIGQNGVLKYEIDESKTPIQMDIIASAVDKTKSTEKGRILAILDFITNDEIKLNISLTGKRALQFDESNKDSTIVLKREK